MDYNYVGIEVIRRLFSVRDEQILRAVFDIDQFIAVCAVVYVKALGVIQNILLSMVIPVMSGASLTSSVVAKPSADAVSLPEVLLAAVASEVLSLSAVLSETDVLSVWLSETSAADAVDVLLSETAEIPDADDVLLPLMRVAAYRQ